MDDCADHVLVMRAQRGEAEAFGALYERYLEDVYRYVFYRLGNNEDAEDMTELTFLKAWQALPRFQWRDTPFRAWLYRIAHNSLVDHYRTHHLEISLELQSGMPDSEAGQEDLLVTRQSAEALAHAIRRLSVDYQQVLTLRFINGLSHAETACAMGRSEAAVRVLQYRALQSLHGLLKGTPLDEHAC